MITSTSNQHVKLLKELMDKSSKRKKMGVFIAEGLRMVSETPKERLKSLYVSDSFMQKASEAKKARGTMTGEKVSGEQGDLRLPEGLDLSEAIVLDDRIFKAVSGTQTPQGILAIVTRQETSLQTLFKGPCPLLMFLENIQDPGNLGTIIRTAEGAGVTGIVMSKDTVDIYNPKTVRSTMGALYRMPFVYVEDFQAALSEAKDAGITLFAAHLNGRCFYTEETYTKPCGFIIGNEGNGLTEAAAEAADRYILIPMEGQVESLNAAVASAILMYEANRQRRL